MLFYNGISGYVLAVKKKKEGINILDEDLYKMTKLDDKITRIGNIAVKKAVI